MGIIRIAPEYLDRPSYYYDTEMQVFITLYDDGNPSHGYEWLFNIALKQRVIDALYSMIGIYKKTAETITKAYDEMYSNDDKISELDKWINDVKDMPETVREYQRSPRRRAHSINNGREEGDYPSDSFGAHSFVDYITYIRFEK